MPDPTRPLRVLVVEDNAINARLAARMFLEDCPKSMAAIRAAVAGRDGPELRLAAHTLKGWPVVGVKF